jgi:hypothetical protein
MMRAIRLFVVGLFLLSIGAPCFAQPVWSQWEMSRPERAGPERSRGVLVHLERVAPDAVEFALALPVREVARVAGLDVLRVLWRGQGDDTPSNAEVAALVGSEISRCRQAGYARVVIGGEGAAAFLAAENATSLSVDGLLVLGSTLSKEKLNDFVDLLSRSKAARIAVALPRQGAWTEPDRGSSSPIRRALQSDRDAFLLLDRSWEVDMDWSMNPGRFTRRYRDCLADVLAQPIARHGEQTCDQSQGYAVGADIGMPDWTPVRLPRFSDPALRPFLGQWRGEDVYGAYVILNPTAVGQGSIDFLHGYSPSPWLAGTTHKNLLRFRLQEGGTKLVHDFWNGESTLKAIALNQAEYVISYRNGLPQQQFYLARTEGGGGEK